MSDHTKPVVYDNGDFWNVNIDGTEFTAIKADKDWTLCADDNWGGVVDAAARFGIDPDRFWDHFEPILDAAVDSTAGKSR